MLRQAIEASPNDGGLHHALGLTLVRLKRQDEAVEALRRATALEPGRAHYAYVYAVGLESVGRRKEAIDVLEANLEGHPHDRDTLFALINFARADGDPATALAYAERLADAEPDNQFLADLIETLRAESPGEAAE